MARQRKIVNLRTKYNHMVELFRQYPALVRSSVDFTYDKLNINSMIK